MARQSSIILTKEDKKARLAEINEAIKGAKADIKQCTSDLKANDKGLAAATKAHAANAKEIAKNGAAADKQLALLEAQKSALVNDPAAGAAPAKTVVAGAEVKAKRTRRTKAEMEAFRASAAA